MGGRNVMNNIIESTKLYNMKIFYLQTLCVLAGIVLFQDSSGQNLVPFANNTFNLGTATRNWKTLFVNNINASGNITAGGTLGVTGISSLGGVQIKGPTNFIGFGSGVLTTNSSGILSSGPLTAAQIPLLPYLPLTGGTLTGPLNGTTAIFTGVFTVTDDAILNKDLNVGNNLYVKNGINVTYDATIGGNLKLNNNFQVGGSITGSSANFASAVTGPTPAPGDNSNNLATTAFVNSAINTGALPYLPLTGGTLTGPLNGTTAIFTGVFTVTDDAILNKDLNVGNNLYVKNGINVTYDATIGGNLKLNNNFQVGGSITGSSANFTSTVTGPTPTPGDNSNNLATTAFVNSAISSIGTTSGAWSLTGNSGTIDGTNFIGTTDAAPLNFKVNNIPSGRIDWNFSSANTFFGFSAGRFITFSNNNLYNGIEGGTNNTGVGFGALSSNTSGAINTAIGSYTLGQNSIGSGNVGIGAGALGSNISGNSLTAIGYQADVNADGYSNSTAIGSYAMITASNIIQLGSSYITKVFAGTGTNATLVAGGLQITGGTLAAGNVLTSDASGNATWQPLAGSSSNSWSLTGNSGTVDGTNFIGTTDNVPLNFKVNDLPAGRIDFSNNTLFGLSSGGADGTYNTAIGNRALTENNGGNFNTAMGFAALFSNQNGVDNVGIGYDALDGNSSGNGNVGVGVSTLQENSTGYNLTAVGNYIDVAMDGYFNSTAIGYGANIDGSNEVILGNNFITSIKAQVNGITTLSDGRFKKNINENVPGLEFIKLLKPVTYNYNIKGLEAYRAPNSQSSKGPAGTGTAQPQLKDENAIIQKEKILYTGLVAQDVELQQKK